MKPVLIFIAKHGETFSGGMAWGDQNSEVFSLDISDIFDLICTLQQSNVAMGNQINGSSNGNIIYTWWILHCCVWLSENTSLAMWESYIVLLVAGVKMCAYLTRALDLSERSSIATSGVWTRLNFCSQSLHEVTLPNKNDSQSSNHPFVAYWYLQINKKTGS